MSLRGLTLIVAGANPERLRSALEIAAVQAAIGGRVRLFLQAAAVPLVAEKESAAFTLPPGLPTRDDLLATAFELGVEVMLCQSGLAAAGLDLASFDSRFVAGGLTGLLADLGEDRLIAV